MKNQIVTKEQFENGNILFRVLGKHSVYKFHKWDQPNENNSIGMITFMDSTIPYCGIDSIQSDGVTFNKQLMGNTITTFIPFKNMAHSSTEEYENLYGITLDLEQLKHGISTKNKNAILGSYEVLQKHNWEVVPDDIFEVYDALVTEGNDVINA